MRYVLWLPMAIVLLYGAVAIAHNGWQQCEEPKQEQQQEQKEPEPTNTWIVIYEDRGWQAQGPYIEIRIMVKADKEGQAVADSMKLLMEKFGGQNCGHLKFKECQQKSNAEKK